MKYIIYGAGADGQTAFWDLGATRVSYFCDQGKVGEKLWGREVLSFEEMEEKYRGGRYIIVVASSRFQIDMELQLKQHGIKRYFIYSENWYKIIQDFYPIYHVYGKCQRMNYTDVLMHYDMRRLKHIAVGNINAALPLLLSELSFHCEAWCIDYIISEDTIENASFMGIPIVPLNKVIDKIDCLVINDTRYTTNIRDYLPDNPQFKVIDIFDIMKFIPVYHHPELKKFKDIHKGERCFIIGNGPSLRIEDLATLHKHNEISFGVNGVAKCFQTTDWRPTYYCISDELGYVLYDKLIDHEKCETFYADTFHKSEYRGLPIYGDNLIHLEGENYGFEKNMPAFSDDITRGVYLGMTVIYEMCLQIAAYMGFDEIYLLGTDCSYPGNDSQGKGTHFLDNYLSEEDKKLIEEYFPNRRSNTDVSKWLGWVFQAYKKAEIYSRSHNFRIYNATRGGNLEEFERVDFDSLFVNSDD